MGAGQLERHIAAVAVADHVDRPDPELADDLGRVVGHLGVREGPRIVGAVAVAALVDADHPAARRERVALKREAVVEVMNAAVQEHDGDAAAADALDVELRAVHLEIAARRSRWIGSAVSGTDRHRRAQGQRHERRPCRPSRTHRHDDRLLSSMDRLTSRVSGRCAVARTRCPAATCRPGRHGRRRPPWPSSGRSPTRSRCGASGPR